MANPIGKLVTEVLFLKDKIFFPRKWTGKIRSAIFFLVTAFLLMAITTVVVTALMLFFTGLSTTPLIALGIVLGLVGVALASVAIWLTGTALYIGIHWLIHRNDVDNYSTKGIARFLGGKILGNMVTGWIEKGLSFFNGDGFSYDKCTRVLGSKVTTLIEGEDKSLAKDVEQGQVLSTLAVGTVLATQGIFKVVNKGIDTVDDILAGKNIFPTTSS